MTFYRNEQELYNRNMKNVDAAYKLVAYRIAQKYHPEKDVAKPHSAFSYWYEHQLQRDIQLPPRPIDPLDYEKKISKCLELLFLFLAIFNIANN